MTTFTEGVADVLRDFPKSVARRMDVLRKQLEEELVIEGARRGMSRDDTLAIVKLGVSAHQRARNLRGSAFEQEVVELLEAALGDLVHVEAQWRHPAYSRRPIDVHLRTLSTDWFFSLKCSPRERAEGTWKDEVVAAGKYCREHGTDLRFVALTLDKVDVNLRARLSRKIEYGSAQSYDFLMGIVQDVRADC